jgi:peptide-methionine (R)-S-oxide reductase
MRRFGTESAGSCALNDEKRPGTFFCAGCDRRLFVAKTKYESNSGWPSFTQPVEGAAGEKQHPVFGQLEVEVHCQICGSHLGHVFADEPPPANLRYCINGVAMNFKPDE